MTLGSFFDFPAMPHRLRGSAYNDQHPTHTAMHKPTYFEKVVSAVASLAECSGGDAQGIIEAYALTQYGHRQNGILDATTWTMDDAEDKGIEPVDLARTILGREA